MLMELKVARAWRVRPSELAHWPMRDRVMASALLLHEDRIGPCGHPHDVSVGDMEGWYEVDDSRVCWACAARDQYLKDHSESGLPPGVLIRVVDTHNQEE